jgi:hypothetical protein
MATQTAPHPLRFFVPFSKVDSETGVVEGFASGDIRDLQGERLPIGVCKAAYAEAESWIGVREMHQPKVVGTFKQWWEEETPEGVPGIMNRVKLSQATDGRDCFLKVQEGALKGFSIGGKGLSFHFDPDGTKVYDKVRIDEISLVDVPACPVAKFTLAKALTEEPEPEEIHKDLSYQERFAALECALSEAAEACVYVCDFGEDWVIYTSPYDCSEDDCFFEDPPPPKHFRATYAIDAAGAVTFSDAEEVVPETNYVPASQTADDLLFGKVVIPRKAGAPATAPHGKPHGQNVDNYADPNNYAWPLDSKGRCRQAMSRYNAGTGKSGYGPDEWTTIGKRIAASATSYFGKPYGVVAGSIQAVEKVLSPEQGVQTMDFKKTLELAVAIQKGDSAGGLKALLDILDQGGADAVDQAKAAIEVMLGSAAPSSPTDSASTASTPSTASTTASTTGTDSTMTKAQEQMDALTKALETIATAGKPGPESPAVGIDVMGEIRSHIDAKFETLQASIATPLEAVPQGPQTVAKDAGAELLGGRPNGNNLAPAGNAPADPGDKVMQDMIEGVIDPMTGMRKLTEAYGGDAMLAQTKAFEKSAQMIHDMGINSDGKRSSDLAGVR